MNFEIRKKWIRKKNEKTNMNELKKPRKKKKI